MALQVANFVEMTLASSVAGGDGTISVTGVPATFPTLNPDTCYLVIEQGTRDAPTKQEVVLATARSGTTITVTRAQDGTSAQSFNAGDRVCLRFVKALYETIRTDAATAASTASTALSDANTAQSTATTALGDASDAQADATALAAPGYYTLATSTYLSGETVLSQGSGVTLTDNGAGSTVTIGADLTAILGVGQIRPGIAYPVGVHSSTSGTASMASGTAYAYYLGRADKAYTSAVVHAQLAVNGSSISYAEWAIASGAFALAGNSTLIVRGYTSIAANITSGAVKTITTSITVSGVTLDMDLWLVYGDSRSGTAPQWTTSNSADTIGAGWIQTASVQPSAMTGLGTAFTLQTATNFIRAAVTLT